MAKVLDIRDRLPPLVLGDNPCGRVATKLLAVLTNDENEPYVHIAALIVTSHTLQRLLKEGYGTSEEEMHYIRERAHEMAENMRVELTFKKGPMK
jgi:hypothetical protein